jgi:hypothetical protein
MIHGWLPNLGFVPRLLVPCPKRLLCGLVLMRRTVCRCVSRCLSGQCGVCKEWGGFLSSLLLGTRDRVRWEHWQEILQGLDWDFAGFGLLLLGCVGGVCVAGLAGGTVVGESVAGCGFLVLVRC